MVFTKQNSLYFHEGSLTPFAWDDSFRRNLDTKSNNLSIGHEWVRNRIKPSCCDLDKNLILFVTLWVGLCEDFHWRRILGQPLAVILLSFLPLSIIYTSQENSHLATVSVTVCVYVCLKCLVFFFMFECSVQCTYSFASLTDMGDLESMKAEAPACRFQREIERVWIPLSSDSTVWKLFDVRNKNIGPSRAKVASEEVQFVILLFWVKYCGLELVNNYTHMIKLRS